MKQKSKKLIILFIISLVMILGFATMVNAADGEFKIREDKEDVVLNGTKKLLTENAGFETVTWTSSNDSVATVSSQGTVTGKAIGTATITATLGSKTATCTVNVIYRSANASSTEVTLVKEIYESKTITITAKDDNLKEIANPEVQWKSNDEGIAKVDSNGKITAVKAGNTKITATVPGKTVEINVTVSNAPVFTDFSKAEYEVAIRSASGVNLNIKNVNHNNHSDFFYCITSKNEKPKVEFDNIGYLSQNGWDNLYDSLKTPIEKYVELNQDMYLWIYEKISLTMPDSYKPYVDDNGKTVNYIGKFVVSGQKLTRPKSPVYAETFTATVMTHDHTQLVFNIPHEEYTERKFTLKIGKITDKNILNGIKNNKGEAWNSLLEYAKNSKAIFNNKITTNKKDIFAMYDTDGINNEKRETIQLSNLENKAYYYMYVVFDDENGKYYPQSGLTIAKADVFTEGESKGMWYMFFLGDDDFKWDDFGVIQTGTATVDKNTTSTKSSSPSKLPCTGATTLG